MRIAHKTMPALAALYLAQQLVLSLPALAGETAAKTDEPRQLSMVVMEHIPAAQTVQPALVNQTVHTVATKPGVVEQFSGSSVSSRAVSSESIQQFQGTKLMVGIEKQHPTIIEPGKS